MAFELGGQVLAERRSRFFREQSIVDLQSNGKKVIALQTAGKKKSRIVSVDGDGVGVGLLNRQMNSTERKELNGMREQRT